MSWDCRQPDVNLEIGSGSHTVQTAGVMLRLETELNERRPDLVLVVGDVNSTVAAALVASKLGIRVAHVEAGLRSFDRRMPEETNRLVTDVLSDYLFASEPSGVRNLLHEGIPKEKIFLVGNVMIDTLMKFRDKAAQTGILGRLGLKSRGYAVATLHRPSNVDEMEHLARLMNMLAELSRRLPLVFPVHPRTRERIEGAGLTARGLILTEPLGYLEFLGLTSEARLVLTDSGGIQEETTILQVPCLTMRENTERPITIEQGTNRLVGTDPKQDSTGGSRYARRAAALHAAAGSLGWQGQRPHSGCRGALFGSLRSATSASGTRILVSPSSFGRLRRATARPIPPATPTSDKTLLRVRIERP